MKTANRRAMTLIEVTIGFAIFTAIGAMFIGYLTSSSKEMAFTGDHFNAVVLSQKVSEDLLEELAINPYGLETLGIDKTRSNWHDVVDGSSVFFSFIEDRYEPWGLIEPTKDGMINKEMQPLYGAVNKFKFNVSGGRMALSGEHEDRNLVACNIDFAWKSSTGRGEFNSSCELFSPAMEKKVSLGVTLNESAIDARIPAEVFQNPAGTVGELAAAAGENVDTILALGRISLICRDFVSSQFYRDVKSEIQTLNLKLQGVSSHDFESLFETRKGIAKAWYSLAKACFQIVCYLEPHFAVLQAQGKFDGSTGAGFNPIAFQQDLMNYRIIYEYFAGSIIQSRHFYYSLLTPELVAYKGNKIQQQVIQKLMDIYRITAVLPTRPTAMSEYRDFLERLKDFSANRQPFLYRMVVQELSFIQNRTDWLKRFPNLARVDSIVTGKMPAILAFIKTQTVGMLATPTN